MQERASRSPDRTLVGVDLTPGLLAPGTGGDATEVWARSGAMGLTGRADGPPLAAPSSLVTVLAGAACRLAERTEELGLAVEIDGPRLLGERAALMGLSRGGQVSCGGSTRLLPVADGWLAVALARDDDVALVPAWLGIDEHSGDVWEAVAEAVRTRPARSVVAAAAELGLPCGRLGERARRGATVMGEQVADAAPVRSADGLRVVDLSSLWAGPLGAQLLGGAGMRVVKVESIRRPDGARLGHPGFYRLLNGDKESVALDLGHEGGIAALHAIVRWADVVVEGSRPRALEHLGLHARDVLTSGGPQVWVSITGHGRGELDRDRVGFGDDAAVAGGLVAWDGDGPCFVADAAPDPASGLLAAVAAVDRLRAGGRWLIDVALSRTAALLATGEQTGAWSGDVAEATTRPSSGAPAELGAHTEAVLADVVAGRGDGQAAAFSRMWTPQAEPRPMTWARPIRAPSIWRGPASPRR